MSTRITTEEISASIKLIKVRRACGLDDISNKVMKFGDANMVKALTNIFKQIMETGNLRLCYYFKEKTLHKRQLQNIV